MRGNDHTESPEDLHLHRETITSLLKKLSIDAKLILFIVYNTPGELSELLFGNSSISLPKSKILPRHTLYIPKKDVEMVEYMGSTPGISAMRFYLNAMTDYLTDSNTNSLGWSKHTIRRTMKELKTFCTKIVESKQ